MKTKTILKIVVMLVIFIALAWIGEVTFGWIGAAAAVGIGGVIALIGFQVAKHAGGGGGSGGGGVG